MKNDIATRRPSSNTPLRQLELTINQVTRSLRRTLREAEDVTIKTQALEDLELDLNPDAPFGLLAQAGGPPWMAVQLRCALLRDLVSLSERLHQCAPTESPQPTEEPPPEPVRPPSVGEPLPEIPVEDPYELPEGDPVKAKLDRHLLDLLGVAKLRLPDVSTADRQEKAAMSLTPPPPLTSRNQQASRSSDDRLKGRA